MEWVESVITTDNACRSPCSVSPPEAEQCIHLMEDQDCDRDTLCMKRSVLHSADYVVVVS